MRLPSLRAGRCASLTRSGWREAGRCRRRSNRRSRSRWRFFSQRSARRLWQPISLAVPFIRFVSFAALRVLSQTPLVTGSEYASCCLLSTCDWFRCTMLQYFTKTWSGMRIYLTKAYQEIWVGLALTSYFYYKLSYGGKKAVADKSSAPAHH